MYICVDFDGTIVEHSFPRVGQPVPGAIEWMKRFTELGGKIILFTMRSDVSEDENYLTRAVFHLRKNGVELFGINKKPTQDRWTTSPKAYGNVYIDDAAIGCPMHKPEGFSSYCVDWSIVGPEVERRIMERIPQ